MSKSIIINGILSFDQSNIVIATVKLWEANNENSIHECTVKAEAEGKFTMKNISVSDDSILYLTAELHEPEVVLLSVEEFQLVLVLVFGHRMLLMQGFHHSVNH